MQILVIVGLEEVESNRFEDANNELFSLFKQEMDIETMTNKACQSFKTFQIYVIFYLTSPTRSPQK